MTLRGGLRLGCGGRTLASGMAEFSNKIFQWFNGHYPAVLGS